MSAAKKKKTEQTWELTGPWASAWKIFAGIGALGAVGAGAGAMSDPRRFAFSWLWAFVTCLTIALGAIFFVLIQRLTSAGWSVTVRRTAEFFAYGILALLPLFIPVLLYMGHLFPWLGHGEHAGAAGAGEHHSAITLIAPAYAQDHAAPAAQPAQPAHPAAAPEHGAPAGAHAAAPAAGGHGGGAFQSTEQAAHAAHAQTHAEIIQKKAPYLNKNFFFFRVAIYFLVWAVLAIRLFGYSAAQDTSKDPSLTTRAQAFAPPATFLYALTLTFAAFDWIMSLEPTWFSTIFGVVIFAAGVVSSLAVIILTTMALRSSGPLAGAVTVEHYHDLGKLMWGFLIFWAYVQFSQFMLIWYAALPEETTFFHNRWDHDPWQTVSMALIIGHFVVPFFWLISRNFKRNLGRLQIGAAILLIMHAVDMYWFVMPNYQLGKAGFSFHWLDAACLLAVGGIYGAFVFFRMTKYPLIPVGDPRLQRSLHFQNA